MSRTTDGFRAVRARRHAQKHHGQHARQVTMLRALLSQGNHQGTRIEALETEVTRLSGHHPKPVDWTTADLGGLGRRR